MHPRPEQIDEFTLDDADHVLDYDRVTKHGGHRAGGGIAGKDEFPVGWGRVEVKAWVDAILARPSAIGPGRWQNSFAFRGTHDGVHGVVWALHRRPWQLVHRDCLSTALARTLAVMTQAEWTEALYARVRPQFDAETQAELDDILVHAGALLACIDLIAMAVEGVFTLTPDELRAARGYAEGGKLLKSSAYLAEGLRKLPVAA